MYKWNLLPSPGQLCQPSGVPQLVHPRLKTGISKTWVKSVHLFTFTNFPISHRTLDKSARGE